LGDRVLRGLCAFAVHARGGQTGELELGVLQLVAAHHAVASTEALHAVIGKLEPGALRLLGQVERLAVHGLELPAGVQQIGHGGAILLAVVGGEQQQQRKEERMFHRRSGRFALLVGERRARSDQLLSITGITSMRMSSPASPASPGSRMPARLGALISRITVSVSRLFSMSSRKRELKPMVMSSPSYEQVSTSL